MSLTERSDKSRWVSGSGSITEVTVVPKTYDLFREYGKFMFKELTAHIKVYVDANNQRADQNYEMLATCILAYVSARNRAKLHAIYNDFNISGMVYVELVFKGLVNKAIVDNKQTARYLRDQYDNLPAYITTCDSNIETFIIPLKTNSPTHPVFVPLPGRCATNILRQWLSTGVLHQKHSSSPSMLSLTMNHHPQRDRQRGAPMSMMDTTQMKSPPCLINRG